MSSRENGILETLFEVGTNSVAIWVFCQTVDRFVSQPPHDPIIKLYRSVVGIQTKASFKSERGPSEGDVVSTLVQRLETLGGAKSH